MRLRYIIYMLLFLTLSCVKEQEELVVPDGEVTATISYTVVVHGSQATRASIDGPFGTGRYIFQTGDRLFVVDAGTGGTNLYGVLTLIEGADTYSGTFEGTLSCVGGFSPTDETELSATLVGVGQDEAEAPATPFFTISGDKVTAVNYPSSIAYEAGGLAEYVKKYSNFTSTSTYGAKSFTLTQQTVFVNFSLSHIAKACLTNPSATEIGVSIKSGDPLTTVRTFTDIPWAAGGNAHIGSVNFTGVFKTSDNIGSGQICVEDCTIPITSDDYDGNFAADQTLVANKYYSVTRSFDPHWPGFKITATADNTTVYFNYYDNADGIEYSLNDGTTWIPYTTREGILLNKDDVVCFKGNRVTYENQQGDQYETPANKPIFTADQLCNISGNIMSLLRDEDDDETTIAARAFSGAFSTGSGGKTSNITYINIDPSNPLILPATVLGDRCYKNMFRQCINLKAIPALPATTVSQDCYRGMFRSCTKLDSVFVVLPAPVLAQDCYREMFRDCSNLAYVRKDMLPSTMLATSCYQQMFSNCKFKTAPDLPAEALVTDCYNTMFSNVKQLKSMTCLAANPDNGSYTKDWVKGVTTGDSERTFIKNSVTQDDSGSTPTTKWPRGDSGIPSGWTATDYVAPAP